MIKEWARWLGEWLLKWSGPIETIQPVPVHDDPEIIAAVFKGYICYGLPVDEFEPDFDLMAVGKFYDVLGYASHVLGTAAHRRTVCELVDYLRRSA